MGDYINVKEIFGCDVFNDSGPSAEEGIPRTEKDNRRGQGAVHGDR